MKKRTKKGTKKQTRTPRSASNGQKDPATNNQIEPATNEKIENDFDWTIIVYLGGDNNLGQEMIWALKNIFDQQIPRRIRVVALYDGGGPPVRFPGKPQQAAQSPAHAPSGAVPPLADGAVLANHDIEIKKLDSKDPVPIKSIEDTLTKFILDNVDGNSAHYMIVLSGHGSGVVGEFLTADKRAFGLSIPTLYRVLKKVINQRPALKKFDILGLDACEMAMTEVAYQVRDEVDYIVGSEGFQPNTGWPYDRILCLLRQNAALDPPSLAQGIVRENISFYLDYAVADISTDTSAVNIVGNQNGVREKLQGVIDALREFTTAMDIGADAETELGPGAISHQSKEALDKSLEELSSKSRLNDSVVRDAIVLARHEAQGYKNEQYVDLWDFCDCLNKRLAGYPEIKKACEHIQDAIAGDNGVVMKSGYAGAAFQHSHGLSIYFPWAKLTDAAGIADLDHYQLLDFSQATRWDEFLRLFHYKTVREMRSSHTTGKLHISRLNRRDGLFTGEPGFRDPQIGAGDKDPQIGAGDKDPQIGAGDKGGFGTASIASMKNPPITWYEIKL